MNKAAKIRTLLAEGMTVADIAKKLKINSPYVAQVKWHWQGGRKSRRTKPVKQNAQKLMASRFTVPKLEQPDMVNHPPHYKVGGIETVDFIEAKGLDYHLGNVVKYVSRAMHKGNELEDLKKAQWYLTRRIEKLST